MIEGLKDSVFEGLTLILLSIFSTGGYYFTISVASCMIDSNRFKGIISASISNSIQNKVSSVSSVTTDTLLNFFS